jgi:hypothetical protein
VQKKIKKGKKGKRYMKSLESKKPKKEERGKELAEEHWTWIKSLLNIKEQHQQTLNKKLFIDGFIHGYKHARQDTNTLES